MAQQFFQKTDLIDKQLKIAAVNDPGNANAQLNLIRHWIGLAQYENALSALNKLEKQYPDNSIVHYEKARCFIATSQTDSANIHLKQALAQNPQFTGAIYLAGELAFQEQYYDEGKNTGR